MQAWFDRHPPAGSPQGRRAGRCTADPAEIDECFDESRYLEHAGEVIARLDQVEPA